MMTITRTYIHPHVMIIIMQVKNQFKHDTNLEPLTHLKPRNKNKIFTQIRKRGEKSPKLTTKGRVYSQKD